MQSSRQRRHAGSSNTLAHCGRLAVGLLKPCLQTAQQKLTKDSILLIHIAMSEETNVSKQSDMHALRHHAAAQPGSKGAELQDQSTGQVLLLMQSLCLASQPQAHLHAMHCPFSHQTGDDTELQLAS